MFTLLFEHQMFNFLNQIYKLSIMSFVCKLSVIKTKSFRKKVFIWQMFWYIDEHIEKKSG
jgi:hypothetical protein